MKSVHFCSKLGCSLSLVVVSRVTDRIPDSRRLARNFRLAFVPVELLLKARLRIGSRPEGVHRNFKFPTAKCADSERRSGAQPF